jgi:hypothetical protein
MDLTQGFGLLTTIVVLAGVSVAIVNGDKTAKIFGAGADGFAKVIRAATLQDIQKKK